MPCKACSNSFCLACIQYEVHACKHLSEMATEKRTKLADVLISQKTVADKLKDRL